MSSRLDHCLRLLPLGFWWFFVIWMTVGFFTALLGVRMPPSMRWADAWSILLGLILTYFWMVEKTGVRTTRLSFLLVFCLSSGIEILGSNTGFPFGSYYYTDRFSSLFFGTDHWTGIPFIIPVAWIVLCLNSFYVARQITRNRDFPTACLLGGSLMMLTDLNLEAVAWYMRGYEEAYWRWNSESVPVQNYLSWFACGTLFLILCPLRNLKATGTDWRPLAILISYNLVFFAHRVAYWLSKQS
ncbi:MAG: carotenoid biosynthesis protein [Verrucomicrobiae bacterium]|nr:carotenoid biosynthesis protein [Verrucomicrobiae bacterium]